MNEMNQPLISVIVPVYNSEEYLCPCLDSILDQSYHNLQIILIANRSTDRSDEICDEYALRDSRIEVLHQANTGLSDARNKGIELARGQYLSFVDGDDCLHPAMLEQLYQALKEQNCLMSMCGFDRFDSRGIQKCFRLNWPSETISGVQMLEEKLQYDLEELITVWGKLYDRCMFETLRFSVGKSFEDLFITPQLYYQAGRIALVRQGLYLYRLREGSITMKPYSLVNYDRIEGDLVMLEFYRECELSKESQKMIITRIEEKMRQGYQFALTDPLAMERYVQLKKRFEEML